MRGLPLIVASGGHSSSRCVGLSLSWPLLLRSTGFRRTGSVIVAHGPSCSAACGIFPDQSSNPCPLHWQTDSQPLRHQGSPGFTLNVVHSMVLDKYMVTCTHHYSIIQSIFTALKMSCAPCIHPYLPTKNLVTAALFTVSIVLPFPEYHILRIIQYIAFWDWPLSLSNIHLRFLHAFLWLDISFLFATE